MPLPRNYNIKKIIERFRLSWVYKNNIWQFKLIKIFNNVSMCYLWSFYMTLKFNMHKVWTLVMVIFKFQAVTLNETQVDYIKMTEG